MAFRLLQTLSRLAILGAAAAMLAACTESDLPKDLRPVSYKLTDKMRAQGMATTAPILIRIFKEESALEVWKQKKDGTYDPDRVYVLVAGANLAIKHQRSTGRVRTQTGRIEREMPIHISNVALVGKDGGPVRVGYRVDADGVKTRVEKKTGNALPKKEA